MYLLLLHGKEPYKWAPRLQGTPFIFSLSHSRSLLSPYLILLLFFTSFYFSCSYFLYKYLPFCLNFSLSPSYSRYIFTHSYLPSIKPLCLVVREFPPFLKQVHLNFFISYVITRFFQHFSVFLFNINLFYLCFLLYFFDFLKQFLFHIATKLLCGQLIESFQHNKLWIVKKIIFLLEPATQN